MTDVDLPSDTHWTHVVTTKERITDRFWEELQAKPIVMLRVVGDHDNHLQPMMAQFEGRLGPLWFFSRQTNALYTRVATGARAVVSYMAPGHDVCASILGVINQESNAKVVDRFWTAQVSAWYDGGKDDPDLTLLRFVPETAKIWLTEPAVGTRATPLSQGREAAAAAMVAEVRF